MKVIINNEERRGRIIIIIKGINMNKNKQTNKQTNKSEINPIKIANTIKRNQCNERTNKENK